MVTRHLAAILICLLTVRSICAQPPEPAFALDDIDLEHSACLRDGKPQPVGTETLQCILGYSPNWNPWSGGQVKRGEVTFHYRIAFKEPVRIGSVFGGVGQFRYLKPDAPYPGDPDKPEHWLEDAVPSGRGTPRLFVLPPRTETRAVLCTEKRTQRGSRIAAWRFHKERFHSVTPLAHANAQMEYTVWPAAAPPHTYAARDVLRGGEWRSSGKNKEGNNVTPPITDMHPMWFVLSWKEPQTIQALALRTNVIDARVYSFIGPPEINPAVGTKDEWKWQRKARMAGRAGRNHGLVWLVFDEPIETRGLKLDIRGTDQQDPQVAWISTLHVLSPLGDGPVPRLVRPQADLSPFVLPYELPEQGYLTMVIEDEQGRRVRNLVANTVRGAGNGQEPWDLKNEAGRYVEPGTYRRKALFHPPLRLRYEMSAYPNVTTHFPDRAAWLTGHNGPHGWMADHTPPRAVAVAGDRVWFGSPVAESGVSLIECTLDGKKQWATHSFAGFTGVWWLAADDTCVYIGANACNTAAEWKVDPSTEAVWSIDLKTHEQKTVARLQPTNSRKRGAQDMDARDGKLYISVRGQDPWLSNAAKPADVDLTACVPRYKPKRKPKRAYEVVPDPQNDFLRLFRLTGRPAGYARGHGLTYLESTRGLSNQQHIVLAFSRPVALGSAMVPVPIGVDYRVKLSYLKPDAPFPPNPEDRSQWTPVKDLPELPWDCVTFPEKTRTRALRITMYRGEDDIISQLQDETGGIGPGDIMGTGEEKGGGLGLGGKPWQGQLEGMKLLRRRYRNLSGTAKVRVSSGHVDESGVWDAERNKPVTPTDPAIYVMQWEKPQNVRGLAIKEIDGKRTEIDVYTGPAGAEIGIEGREHWQQIAAYTPTRRVGHSGFESHNGNARYVDGYVDFGRAHATRAIRLRVVSQWAVNTYVGAAIHPDYAQREAFLDPTRARVFGVAPLEYLGGEEPVDPLISERIEVFDTAQGKITQETYVEKPGQIAFAPDGKLYAVSGAKVILVDLAGGKHKEIIADLEQPRALACGPDGEIYVYDHHPERKNVRVYDGAGKFLREIGKTGGYRVGPWDPYRLNSVTGLDVDKEEHLWVVEDTYYPKRIAQFTTQGEFIKETYGPTRYGGNGVLDPYDKRRLFLDRLEFELDWDAGTVRLKNLTTLGPHAGEVPIRVDGRTYLVTRPMFAEQQCGVVHLYEKDRTRMVAAVGRADAFHPLGYADVMRDLGNVALPAWRFIWCDRNGDGKVQAAEVKLSPSEGMYGLANFNRDLGIQGGRVRYVVKEFLPNGAPVYEEEKYPLQGRCLVRMDNGNFFHMAGGRLLENVGYTPEGEKAWLYKTEGSGVHGLFKAEPYFDGQVVSQFGIVGHETAHAGDLGEFVVIHSNVGAWSVWTADGLFAGDILRNYRRGGARFWHFPEHERGLDLTNVSAGQEHFSGYFCRTFADDKYYIVAGHNHASVVEVQGIEKFKRFEKDVVVTTDDLRRVQQWEHTREKEEVYLRASVMDCYRKKVFIRVDGSPDDWQEIDGVQVSATGNRGAALRMTYDDKRLYLLYATEGLGPMRNKGEQWRRLFKTGAAVDLQLALDPKADPAREAPVEGDLRLLMTYNNGQYVAVLYRAVVPGTAPEATWVVASPVGRVTFDEVRLLKGAQMACQNTERGYVFEAAVPLKELGLEPKEGLRLKMDWGVLVADRGGNAVTQRLYWANKATDVIADAPSEARLHPNLWGTIRFHGVRTSPTSASSLLDFGEEKKEPADEGFIEELEETFK